MYFIYVKGLMTNSLALLHVEVNLCRLEGAVNLNLGIQIMSTHIFIFRLREMGLNVICCLLY